VKDLFLVLQKQILHSVQDDKIMETEFCKMLSFMPIFMIDEIRGKEQGLIFPEKAGCDHNQPPNRR
jgi:hypothetical protein